MDHERTLSRMLQNELRQQSDEVVQRLRERREQSEAEKEAQKSAKELTVNRHFLLGTAVKEGRVDFLLIGLDRNEPKLSLITGVRQAVTFTFIIPDEDLHDLQVPGIDQIQYPQERLKQIATRLPDYLEGIHNLSARLPLRVFLSFQDRRQRKPAAVAQKDATGQVTVTVSETPLFYRH